MSFCWDQYQLSTNIDHCQPISTNISKHVSSFLWLLIDLLSMYVTFCRKIVRKISMMPRRDARLWPKAESMLKIIRSDWVRASWWHSRHSPFFYFRLGVFFQDKLSRWFILNKDQNIIKGHQNETCNFEICWWSRKSFFLCGGEGGLHVSNIFFNPSKAQNLWHVGNQLRLWQWVASMCLSRPLQLVNLLLIPLSRPTVDG